MPLAMFTRESILQIQAQLLTETDKIIILETVLDKPEVLLRELQQTLVLETGTCVDVSTMWRFLQVSNFTRQDGDGS